MGVTRRDFLRFSGGAVVAGSIGMGTAPGKADAAELRIKNVQETRTICPFCSVGCGIIVHTKNGKVINTEGDQDHPINEGSLCSKGASLYQLVNNPQRLTRPRHRAPGSAEWKEVEWDWTLNEIAKRIKQTRDKTFKATSKSRVKEKSPDGNETEVEKDFVVNRIDSIAHIGSAQIDNEECYILQKWLRSLGLVYIEHQARI